MMLKYLFPLILSLNAFAEVRPFVGVDLFQNISKQGRFEYDNTDAFKKPHKNLTRLAVGVTYKPFEDKHIWLSFRTNRLANGYMKRTAFDRVAKQEVQTLQRVVSESFIVATALHKYFLPYVFTFKGGSQFKSNLQKWSHGARKHHQLALWLGVFRSF